MRLYSILAVFFVGLTAAGGASGDIILVPTDEPTIAAAIAAAGPADNIELLPGTYTEPGLTIDKDVTIGAYNYGDPADHIIQAADTPGTASDRVFTITNGWTVLQGVTIRNGNVAGSGGGIYCSGINTTLDLWNCTVSGNEAGARGGGIYNSGATINPWQSTISGNTAGDEGGGIYCMGGGGYISDSTLSGNQASQGGGIYAVDHSTWITGNTINGNTVSGNGGGVHMSLLTSGGTLTLANNTFSGNTATVHGGGIYAYAGTGATLTMHHSTISSNTATTGEGGGIYATGNTPPDVHASIFANNTAPTGPDINGAINSLDYNLIENTSGATINGATANNITGADPNLGPLQDKGGPTQTHALLPGSPALDVIPEMDLMEYADQRQAPRPQNLNGDIGAFELFVDDWGVTNIYPWQDPWPDNGTIYVSIEFDQLVENFNNINDLVITTTGTLSFTGATGFDGGLNFVVMLEGVTGTGTVQISVNTESDIVTPFGAPLTTSVTCDPFFSDNDPPGISIGPPSVPITETGPVTFTVSYFDEDIVTLDESDITLIPTGDADADVAVDPAKDIDYTVTLWNVTGQGSLGFTIAQGSATDAAGNPAPSATTPTPVQVGIPPLPLAAWPLALALLLTGAARTRRR